MLLAATQYGAIASLEALRQIVSVAWTLDHEAQQRPVHRRTHWRLIMTSNTHGGTLSAAVFTA